MGKTYKRTTHPKRRQRDEKGGIIRFLDFPIAKSAVAYFSTKSHSLDRTELAGPALGLLIAGISIAIFDPSTALVSCLLGWTMLAIAISDARNFIIPDLLSLPAIPAGLVYSGLSATLRDPNSVILEHTLSAVLAAAFFYAIAWGFRALRKHDGLGLGDVKLAAVAGAWTGMEGVSLVVLGASLIAICYTVLLRLAQDRKMTRAALIPFGAFLAPSIWLAWSLLELNGH